MRLENRRLFLQFTGMGIAYLIFSLFYNYTEFSGKFDTSKTLKTLNYNAVMESSLVYDIIYYLISLLLIHLIFSTIAYFLYQPISRRLYSSGRKPYFGAIVFFSLIIIWLTQLNSTLYIRSVHSQPTLVIDYTLQGFVWILLCIIFSILLIINIRNIYIRLLANRILYKPERKHIYRAAPVISIITAVIFYNSVYQNQPDTKNNASASRPNIIIISIDSLRQDIVTSNNKHSQEHVLHNIFKFREDATNFSNTTTPLARTYPSWVSTLTGQYPVTHGARANLAPPDKIVLNNNLASILKQEGYTTAYAIDERRFNNIDKSYGFDFIVGPKTGAGDFLFGTVNDLPLSNVISNLKVSKYLFPFNYSNRAVHKTYDPDTFLNEIDGLLGQNGRAPLFLNIHLCLPHWPYKWAKGERNIPFNRKYGVYYNNYLNSVIEADLQFGEIIRQLEKYNLLDNALVLLMSDHGESFSHDVHTIQHFTSKNDTNAPYLRSSHGHGSDLRHPSQNTVVFSAKEYGQAKISSGEVKQNISLIDIAPTVLDYLNIPTDKVNPDGISLLPLLKDNLQTMADRFFFMETGFNIANAITADHVDTKLLTGEGSKHYNISKDGRLIIKEDSLTDIINTKQRSVKFREWLLYFKNDDLDPVLINTESMTYWNYSEFESAPEAPVKEMLTAICQHYHSELNTRNGYCSNKHQI